MSSQNSVEVDIQVALLVAQTAGTSTLKYFRNPELKVESKDDSSPVTEADKKAEELARDLLNQKFPNDSIQGEEFGLTEGSSGRMWVIDPIDGTRSFVSGVPTYSTLLALGNLETDVWDLGIIHIPALKETIYAYRGGGCWFQTADGIQAKATVSTTKKLEQAKVVASGADYVPNNVIETADIFRTWGDGYGYLLLATGQVDAMFDIDLAVWDYAPLQVVVEEAGGKFLNWNDAPAPTTKKDTKETKNCIATNGVLNLKNFAELS